MRAARIRAYTKPLVLEDVPVPEIQPDEALVQVRACGMCRSDVQFVDGYFRKYIDIPTPIIPGHEITDIVHTLGSLASKSAGLHEYAPDTQENLFIRHERYTDAEAVEADRRSEHCQRIVIGEINPHLVMREVMTVTLLL